MKKAFKIIASVLGLVILLAVIAAILLVTFVSPNRLKPMISEYVMEATGRTLTIDGDLSWTFFPILGVKVGHLSLSNPENFKQKTFAEINEATVSVKLLPLLHGQIESSGVALNGMKLYLIKNTDGQTNWENSQKAPQLAIQSSQEKTVSHAALALAVSALDVSHASIIWLDEQTKNNFSINDFELHAKNISLSEPFHFSTAFNFTSDNPAMTAKIHLSSDLLLDLSKNIYKLNDMELTAKINQMDLIIHSNVEANLEKQTISLDDFIGQSENMSFNGKLNISNVSTQPQIVGSVQINPVDMKAWLRAAGHDVASLKVMKNVSGTVDFSVKTPAKPAVQGRFKIDNVETTKLKVSDINIEMHYKDNVIQLVPVTAKLYQGDLYSQIKIDLNGTAPQFAVQANLSNIQVEPLLADAIDTDQKIKLSGMGKVDLQITTAGATSQAITRNLNGTGSLKFENGVLTGIDIGYLIDSAYALVKQKPMSSQDTNKTTFGNMTATVTVHDGVVTNNDLHFESPRFNTTGNGNIDLVNQLIDYSLLTTVKKVSADRKDDALNLYGLAIPINISGGLNNPKIRLNTDALLKQIAQKQFQDVKENVQEQIQNKVNEQLKGEASKLLNNLLGH